MSKLYLIFMACAAIINITGWIVTDISMYAFNSGFLLFVIIDEVLYE